LDIDGNGATESLTDGLLILGAIDGFTGDTLIDNKVDTSAGQRIYADEISNYLEKAQTNMLDVDGNGEIDSLTDGLIQLAYMDGFRGELLTKPSPESTLTYIGTGATRTTGEQLAEFLDMYMPSIVPNNSASLI